MSTFFLRKIFIFFSSVCFFFSCRPNFQIPATNYSSHQSIFFREIQFIKPGYMHSLTKSEREMIQKDISNSFEKRKYLNKNSDLEIDIYMQSYWDDYISGYYMEKDSIFYVNSTDNRIKNLKIFWPGLVFGLYMFYGVFPIVPRAGKITIYLDASVKYGKKSRKIHLEEYDYYSSFSYAIYKTENIEKTFHEVYYRIIENLTKEIIRLDDNQHMEEKHNQTQENKF